MQEANNLLHASKLSRSAGDSIEVHHRRRRRRCIAGNQLRPLCVSRAIVLLAFWLC